MTVTICDYRSPAVWPDNVEFAGVFAPGVTLDQRLAVIIGTSPFVTGKVARLRVLPTDMYGQSSGHRTLGRWFGRKSRVVTVRVPDVEQGLTNWYPLAFRVPRQSLDTGWFDVHEWGHPPSSPVNGQVVEQALSHVRLSPRDSLSFDVHLLLNAGNCAGGSYEVNHNWFVGTYKFGDWVRLVVGALWHSTAGWLEVWRPGSGAAQVNVRGLPTMQHVNGVLVPDPYMVHGIYAGRLVAPATIDDAGVRVCATKEEALAQFVAVPTPVPPLGPLTKLEKLAKGVAASAGADPAVRAWVAEATKRIEGGI